MFAPLKLFTLSTVFFSTLARAQISTDDWFSKSEVLKCQIEALDLAEKPANLKVTWQGDGFFEQTSNQYFTTIDRLQIPGPNTVSLEVSANGVEDREDSTYQGVKFKIQTSANHQLNFYLIQESDTASQAVAERFDLEKWKEVGREVDFRLELIPHPKQINSAVHVRCDVGSLKSGAAD